MSQFEELEVLSKESEEYQMLMGVAEEFDRLQTGSAHTKSGKATQMIIHQFLLGKNFRLPKTPEVEITEVQTKMNLLYLLNTRAGGNKSQYSVHELDVVLKIVNNAVGKNYKDKIKNTFEKFKRANPKLCFAVIVLSESAYMHRLKTEDFGEQARLFTLITRKKSAHELYLKKTVEQLWENGELRKPEDDGLTDLMEWLKGK